MRLERDEETGALTYAAPLGGGGTLRLRLTESIRGAGDWALCEVTVSAGKGWLTAGDLRSLPYGGHLRDALQLATREQGQQAKSSSFSSPSDPPASFRVDRRGNKARSERDYARLAYVEYVTTDPARRLELPRRWSARFGREASTWRNDLSKARRRFVATRDESDNPITDPYVLTLYDEEHVGPYLTGEALRLIYGDDFLERLEPEDRVREAERYLEMRDPGRSTPLERSLARQQDGRLRRLGGDPEARVERAEGLVGTWYSDGGPR